MPFFDDSHVTDVGMQGSFGPSVGLLDIFQQSVKQQFRVDSARALNTELQNRWIDSLRNLERNGGGKFNGPLDQEMYIAFAEHSQGKPISVTRMGVEGEGYGARLVPGDVTQNAYFQEMLRANEAIKKLNNPSIKSFEQILEEVSQMQQEVEGETASMYERGGTGSFLASLAGGVVGSFTHRDPLNVVTAPWGAGRTIATRIAAEAGLAAGITAATELTEVTPNRALAGLEYRNPLYNIAAAGIGGGVIRGGIEGIGYGVGRLRGEDIDFDARDTQLAQMFAANSDKPSARAGAMILDDAVFVEKNNPFGEGRASQERFLAELQQMQRAMNGEPMTAVARVLPPLPFDYIKKAADFEIVREQAPNLWARMEAAQAKVNGPSAVIRDQAGKPITFYRGTVNIDLPNRESGFTFFSTDPEFAAKFTHSSEGGKVSSTNLRAENIGDFRNPEHVAQVKQLVVDKFKKEGSEAPTEWLDAIDRGDWGVWERKWILDHFGWDAVWITEKGALNLAVRSSDQIVPEAVSTAATRRAANAEYKAAYREVESEAVRLREVASKAEAAQQAEASNILARAYGRPFIGPLLRHENVEALVDRINRINETLDEDTIARFQRETVGEGENAIELEVWERDGGIDIGLREPVDPNFTFVTDEGEMTVAAAMRDLQSDVDLIEAIKVCAI